MIDQRSAPLQSWASFAGIALLGLAIRLIGLSTQSLWLDEITSIEIAHRSLATILNGAHFDNHTPPLYYALLHLWGRVIPLTEVGLRLFSALVEPINILLLARICLRFTSRVHTLLISSAYALSPFMLYYAQEGRMYTLTVFFSLATTLAFLTLICEEKGLPIWIGLAGLLIALGTYTHYFHAFFSFGLITASLWVVRRSPRLVRAVLLSGIVGVLLFTPWLYIAAQLAASGAQSFRQFVWSVVPYTVFRFIAGYALFPLDMYTRENFWLAVLEHLGELVLVFGAALLLMLSLFRSRSRFDSQGLAMAAWLFATPMLVGLVLSLKTPILSERYLTMTFPFFLIALLAFQDLRRALTLCSIAAFFVVAMAGDAAYFFNPGFGKAQWREAAKYVSERIHGTDAVLVEPNHVAGVFVYYFGSRKHVYPLPSPPDTENEALKSSALAPIVSRFQRAILVTSGAPSRSDYSAILAQIATKTQTEIFPLETGITCTIWELKPPQLSSDQILSKQSG